MIPILEIATFIQVGSIVGLPLTLFGILLTAVIGAVLVRLQGFKALNDARENMSRQKSPVEQVIHGAFILIAGLLLLTPGFLTDTLGFLFLIPPLRLSIATRIWTWIKANGSININSADLRRHGFHQSDATNKSDGSVIDGQAVEISNPENLDDKKSLR